MTLNVTSAESALGVTGVETAPAYAVTVSATYAITSNATVSFTQNTAVGGC